jgi:hypothetical protein
VEELPHYFFPGQLLPNNTMLSPETKQSGGKLVLLSDLGARTVSGEFF